MPGRALDKAPGGDRVAWSFGRLSQFFKRIAGAMDTTPTVTTAGLRTGVAIPFQWSHDFDAHIGRMDPVDQLGEVRQKVRRAVGVEIACREHKPIEQRWVISNELTDRPIRGFAVRRRDQNRAGAPSDQLHRRACRSGGAGAFVRTLPGPVVKPNEPPSSRRHLAVDSVAGDDLHGGLSDGRRPESHAGKPHGGADNHAQ